MALSIYSYRIDRIINAREHNAATDMLFDAYAILGTAEDREAFVADLIYRMLVELTRRLNYIFSPAGKAHIEVP